MDYSLHRELPDDDVLAWMEVKGRWHRYGKYEDIMLSYSKYRKLRDLTKDSGLPAFFFVRWEDGITKGAHIAANSNLKPKMGGRTKSRRDEYDYEPMVYIPLGEFKGFEDANAKHWESLVPAKAEGKAEEKQEEKKAGKWDQLTMPELMEARNVWVVLESGFSRKRAGGIAGVFSTPEKAKEAMKDAGPGVVAMPVKVDVAIPAERWAPDH